MRITLNGITTQAELEKHLVENGCYAAEENRRIYHKWYADAPRYMFRAVNEIYHLTSGTLCDAGCGYGGNLAYCQPGSYGIEIDQYEADFARSIGLTVHQCDIIYADFADFPKVDAVWNSATLEHVEAPHTFIRKLHQLLKPNGLLALYVPTIPPYPWLRHLPRIGRYFGGHLHGDHINAFTPATLRFFCERAGFQTLRVSSFLPGVARWFDKLHLIDGVTYIGRKIDNWQYPSSATRRAADNPKGFIFEGRKFGE